VPVPGVYADTGPKGCPGRAIFGNDISFEVVIVLVPCTQKKMLQRLIFLFSSFKDLSPGFILSF